MWLCGLSQRCNYLTHYNDKFDYHVSISDDAKYIDMSEKLFGQPSGPFRVFGPFVDSVLCCIEGKMTITVHIYVPRTQNAFSWDKWDKINNLHGIEWIDMTIYMMIHTFWFMCVPICCRVSEVNKYMIIFHMLIIYAWMISHLNVLIN